MLNVYTQGTNGGIEYENLCNSGESQVVMNNYSEQLKLDFEKSLEKTEWIVDIVTKNSRTGKITNGNDLEWDEDGLCDELVPKLDENGCLVLEILK